MAFENPFSNLSTTQKYLVIAGGAGIGGFALYKRHQTTGSWNPFAKSTAAAPGSTAASGTDPITGMPYSDDNAIDPTTNLGYLAEADQYGSVAAAEAAVTAYGQSTNTGSGIGVNPASPAASGSINTPVGTNIYTSNAAWAQAATAGLVSVGYDGVTVAGALGAFETQKPLTADQIAIVNTAIAEYGAPPIGTLQVIPAPASGPGAGIPVTAPSVNGTSHHVDSVTQTTATMSWSGNNAVKYVVTLTGPGPKNGSVQTVTSPKVSYTGLLASHNYSIQILPYNSSGTPGNVQNFDFQTLAPVGKAA
jgi:hypothetical protein